MRVDYTRRSVAMVMRARALDATRRLAFARYVEVLILSQYWFCVGLLVVVPVVPPVLRAWVRTPLR